MRARTKALISVGVIAVVVLAGTAVLRTQRERAAALLGDLATRNFGVARNIKIEGSDIGGSLIRDVRIKDFRITYTGGETPRVLLAATEVYARYDLLSFFRGVMRIDSIDVVSPRLVVPGGSDGRRIYPQGDPGAVPTTGRSTDHQSRRRTACTRSA